ncbi:hypothetical protein C8F01DRAFT_1173946, partial [Mycena amicta]
LTDTTLRFVFLCLLRVGNARWMCRRSETQDYFAYTESRWADGPSPAVPFADVESDLPRDRHQTGAVQTTVPYPIRWGAGEHGKKAKTHSGGVSFSEGFGS